MLVKLNSEYFTRHHALTICWTVSKPIQISKFQCFTNRTCESIQDNFITEDTIETASHFICKDCLQTLYVSLKIHAQRGRGTGVDYGKVEDRSTKAVE
jgi:hypothetical protein